MTAPADRATGQRPATAQAAQTARGNGRHAAAAGPDRGRYAAWAADPVVIVYLALAAAFLLGWLLVEIEGGQFLTLSNVVEIQKRSIALGLVAVGQTVVILAGSLDLSVAYLVSLTSLVAAEVMAGAAGGGAAGIVPGIIAVLAVSAAVGVVNGLAITGLHVNAFIATLGVGFVIKGFLEHRYDGPAGAVPEVFLRLGYDRVGPVPVAALLLGGAAVVVWLLLRRTRFGYHLYAVGGNPEVARLSGVRTGRVVVAAHVICALCAGLAGLFLASRLGAGTPTVGSEGGYDLESIAAVVLGGTVLGGGRGGVAGTVGGVLILAVLDSVFNQLEINPFLKDVVRGVVIIAAVALYARRKGWVRR